ncbi:tyrosine-type recombinase/integrase [Defluviimonas salinarum]|uniref:Tyr recombinase domain-containing protein n=1 Tax=Defluviimonas salinarum TaxID=2992147 RepID=A0ABT3J924_9RHOB|nr:tyrosine-type recombinase/integrase [Defluviimonas salinarum]MCW3784191.1 hypothetical protein [Defluviimonas salinarum]
MVKVSLKGIHRVRKRLADGRMAEYHYAWRGGPRIWDRTSPFRVGSIDYLEVYQRATTARQDVKGTFREIIEAFLSSREFAELSERTRQDHKKNIAQNDGIEARFGSAPIAVFESPKIRNMAINWRDTFSPGTGDNLMATLQRIVSFAYQRGLLGEHRLLKIHRRAKSNRADIVWSQAEIDAFVKGTPSYVGNILIAAVETGLRPGDLQIFGHRNIETTPGGHQRILLRTKKSNKKKFASVPVTPALAKLIARLPKDQDTFIVNSEGRPFANSNSLGKLISDWRDELGLRKELHLYDARGTAVTRLVRAGCTIGELAAHMGWSFQHAAQMLDRYAKLDPEMSDGILEKVSRREAGR